MNCELPECDSPAFALAILPKLPNKLNQEKVELNLCQVHFALARVLIEQYKIPHCDLCYKYTKSLRNWENIYNLCPECFDTNQQNRVTTTMPWIPKQAFLQPKKKTKKKFFKQQTLFGEKTKGKRQ